MATTLRGRSRTGMNGSLKATKEGFSYSETYEYVVVSSVKEENPWDVLTTTGLPLLFVTTLNGLVCTGKELKQDDKSPYVWRVTCEFSADTNGQETGSNPDPETWIPIWSSTIETFPEVMFEDFSTPPKPYVNSAKCKFPEPLVRNRPITVWEFVQYEAASLSINTIADRNETTNNATFKGFAADTLKLIVKGSAKGYYFGKAVTKVDYRVAYKPTKWLNRPLDMSYEYFPSAGATTRLVSDTIVALNANGTKKADNADPVVNTEFKELKPISFSFIRT